MTTVKNKGKPPPSAVSSSDSPVTPTPETWTQIFAQVAPSLLLAGFGMLLAGLLLDNVQSSISFKTIRGIVILVPALLGLKGNLEMTMASRISSVANLGQLSTDSQRQSAYRANMALIQVIAVNHKIRLSFVLP